MSVQCTMRWQIRVRPVRVVSSWWVRPIGTMRSFRTIEIPVTSHRDADCRPRCCDRRCVLVRVCVPVRYESYDHPHLHQQHFHYHCCFARCYRWDAFGAAVILCESHPSPPPPRRKSNSTFPCEPQTAFWILDFDGSYEYRCSVFTAECEV